MGKKSRRKWFVPAGVEPTELEKKVMSFEQQGCLVPDRKLIKTQEQIEGIRRSGVINTGVLDLVAQEIRPGMTWRLTNWCMITPWDMVRYRHR